jgi:hypothetical protein
MRIRRAIIFPAILALGVVSSLLTGSAMSTAAAHKTVVDVHVTALTASPDTLFHA